MKKDEVLISLLPKEKMVYYYSINMNYQIYFTNSRLFLMKNEISEIFPLNSLLKIIQHENTFTFSFIFFKIVNIELNKDDYNNDELLQALNFLLRYKHNLYSLSDTSYEQKNIHKNEIYNMSLGLKEEISDEIKNITTKKSATIYEILIIDNAKNYICYHIYPNVMKSKFVSSEASFEERNSTNLTTISYVTSNEGILLRRGNTGYIDSPDRILEKNLEDSLIESINTKNKHRCRRNLIIPIEYEENYDSLKALIGDNYEIIKFPVNKMFPALDETENSNYYNNKNNSIKNLAISNSYFNKIVYRTLQKLKNNEIVIIEDSHYFQITHILCSLIKIYVDPYYRTIKGFIYLIKREWLNYSFDFSEDIAKINKNDCNKSIFFIFLINIYMTIFCKPNSFGFNKILIETLLYHCCSGYYFPLSHQSYINREFRKDINIFELIEKEKEIFLNNSFDKSYCLVDELEKELQHFIQLDKDNFYEKVIQTRFQLIWKLKLSKIFEIFHSAQLIEEPLEPVIKKNLKE